MLEYLIYTLQGRRLKGIVYYPTSQCKSEERETTWSDCYIFPIAIPSEHPKDNR